jgi:hypothetical protein
VRERHTRNFYKVEKWTKDGIKVDRMLYAGSNPADDPAARARTVAPETLRLGLVYQLQQLAVRSDTERCFSGGQERGHVAWAAKKS